MALAAIELMAFPFVRPGELTSATWSEGFGKRSGAWPCLENPLLKRCMGCSDLRKLRGTDNPGDSPFKEEFPGQVGRNVSAAFAGDIHPCGQDSEEG